MDVGKIHSASSYSKLFTEADKQDVASKKKEKDASFEKITVENKVPHNAILNKKLVSQNVSSSASVSDNSFKDNSSNADDSNISHREHSSEESVTSDLTTPPPSQMSSFSVSPVGTRVEFTIEKELNLVVTTVRDLNNDKVIRQLPPEDTISRMKMLKSYYKQAAQASLGNKVDKIVK